MPGTPRNAARRDGSFVRARWAVGIATLLTVGSAVRYPGGTPLDPTTQGYSISRNFLSDLGMTVAWNRQSNAVGAILFLGGLGILLVGLGGCLLAYVRLVSDTPRARLLARGAMGVGAVVCAAFAGVAFTPEDKAFRFHLMFTLLAFRVFPALGLFLGLASLSSTTVPRRVAIGWMALTVVLAWYVYMLGWGPTIGTLEGLTAQVLAQKTVTVAAMGTFVYVSVEADRILAAARRSQNTHSAVRDGGAISIFTD